MDTLQKLEARVQRLLQDRFNAREPVRDRDPGLLGKTNDAGSATVPGMPQYCYVRVGKDATQAIVFNNATDHTNGRAVIVGYDPAQPTLFQVLKVREAYDPSLPGVPSTGPHHSQHEWGVGSDIVYLRSRQIVDGFVYPTDPASLVVNITDALYVIGQKVCYYEGGTLDLATSVPGSGRRYTLIAFDENGPYAVDGSTASPLTTDSIPQANQPTHWRVAVVYLPSGTTEITDWPAPIMISDLRFTGSRSAAPGGGYFNWPNCIVVAESGADYDNIQDAHDAAVAGDTIWTMPAAYVENIAWTTANLALVGLADRKRSGPYGTYLPGSDEVGPILDVDEGGLFVNLVVNRELTAGSGVYIGIDAGANLNTWVVDSRIDIGAGASGRAVVGVQIGSATESALERCFIRCTNGSTDHAVEILAGAADVILAGCELHGDLVALGACDVKLYECVINGDLTGVSGATLELKGCHVTGTISGWDSVTILGMVPDHDHTGDLSDGGDLTHYLLADGTRELSADWGTGETYGIAELSHIDFFLTYAGGHQEGRLHWNEEDGTLEIGMPGGTVNLQIGQEMLIRCRNETGVQIDDGKVVYVTGASGNKPLVALSKADVKATAIVFGVATESIPHNDNGYVNVGGLVRGIDTSAIAEGGYAFLSAATAGELAATPPDAPNYKARVGYCLVQHATEGVLLVTSAVVPLMMSLTDVKIDTPLDTEWLRYVAANSRFELADDSSVDHGNVSGLADDDHPQYVLVVGDTMTGPLVIDGAADVLQLAVQGDASQAVNLQEWQDSSGTPLAYIEADGTLVFADSATVWDDLQVNLSAVRVPPASAPTWTAYKGSYILAFSKAADEIIYFTAQLPHSYKVGSDIDFHLHLAWPDSGAGDVRWNFTYSWANIGTDFPGETTVTTDAASPADTDKHTLVDIDALAGSGKGISSILLCSLQREGTDVVNDDYDNDVYLIALDFHFEKDTVGSRQETVK